MLKLNPRVTEDVDTEFISTESVEDESLGMQTGGFIHFGEKL